MKRKLQYAAIVLILVYIMATMLQYCDADSGINNNPGALPTGEHIQEDVSNKVAFTNLTKTRKTSFDHCDATQDLIYFSYSQDNCIDAYSYNGSFCFSIYLPEYSKGIIMIRCIDDLLYIRDKTDVVYVYCGTTEIDTFSSREANDIGYSSKWFRNNTEEISVQVGRDVTTLIGEDEQILATLDTPNSIRRNLPILDFGRSANMILSLLGISGLVIFCSRLMYKSYKEAKSKPRYLID